LFAVIDIETTGGSPKTGRIIEIAIVVHNGKRVIEEYSSLINPETPIDPFVAALTGITDDLVADAPTFEEILDTIERLTKGRVFIAHNARFDYSFVKQEYRRLGKPFQRRNLCTVVLSKKLLPGHASYSLGKLCQDLDIPIKNRHRAMGDAAATAVLFERMMFNDKKRLIEDLLKDELEGAILPPNLDARVVKRLPEETGVYYFLDEKGQKIYIGKSKDIRARVLNHFSNDLASERFRQMKDEIHDIVFEVTGSELVAELLEAGEIKRFMPKYNRAQRRKKYRYGVFVKEMEDGYTKLSVDLIHPDRTPLLKFTSKKWAEKAVSDLRKKYSIDPALKETLDIDEYNDRIVQATQKYHFTHPNLLIIDEGRTFDEKVVILIQHGEYKGYGFFDPTYVTGEPEELLSYVKNDYDTPDKRQIVRKHLQKRNRFELIPI